MIFYILLHVALATHLSALLDKYPMSKFTNSISGNTYEHLSGLKFHEVKRMLFPVFDLSDFSQIMIKNNDEVELCDDAHSQPGFSYTFMILSPRRYIHVIFFPSDDDYWEITEVYYQKTPDLSLRKLKKILGKRFQKPYWNMEACEECTGDRISNTIIVNDGKHDTMAVFLTHPKRRQSCQKW